MGVARFGGQNWHSPLFSSAYSLQGPVGPAGGPGFPGAPGAKVHALLSSLEFLDAEKLSFPCNPCSLLPQQPPAPV